MNNLSVQKRVLVATRLVAGKTMRQIHLEIGVSIQTMRRLVLDLATDEALDRLPLLPCHGGMLKLLLSASTIAVGKERMVVGFGFDQATEWAVVAGLWPTKDIAFSRMLDEVSTKEQRAKRVTGITPTVFSWLRSTFKDPATVHAIARLAQAHHNLCVVGTDGRTPAMRAGLADVRWSLRRVVLTLAGQELGEDDPNAEIVDVVADDVERLHAAADQTIMIFGHPVLLQDLAELADREPNSILKRMKLRGMSAEDAAFS